MTPFYDMNCNIAIPTLMTPFFPRRWSHWDGSTHSRTSCHSCHLRTSPRTPRSWPTTRPGTERKLSLSPAGMYCYIGHITTHAKVMADNPSWDGEKTVVITCRYVVLYSSHHHARQGHGRQPVLGWGENCRYHLQVCSVI